MTTYKEVLCNWCGCKCNLEEPPWDYPCGMVEVNVTGGYPSTPGNGGGALDDGMRYDFSLCEFCLDYMFSNFKIPVAVSDYTSNEFETFIPASDRVRKDEWRKQKIQFFTEKFRRDNLRKTS